MSLRISIEEIKRIRVYSQACARASSTLFDRLLTDDLTDTQYCAVDDTSTRLFNLHLKADCLADCAETLNDVFAKKMTKLEKYQQSHRDALASKAQYDRESNQCI